LVNQPMQKHLPEQYGNVRLKNRDRCC